MVSKALTPLASGRGPRTASAALPQHATGVPPSFPKYFSSCCHNDQPQLKAGWSLANGQRSPAHEPC